MSPLWWVVIGIAVVGLAVTLVVVAALIAGGKADRDNGEGL